MQMQMRSGTRNFRRETFDKRLSRSKQRTTLSNLGGRTKQREEKKKFDAQPKQDFTTY